MRLLVALFALALACTKPPPAPEKPVLVAPPPEPTGPTVPCIDNGVELEVPGWPSQLAAGHLETDGHLDVVVNYLATGPGKKGHHFISLRGDGQLGLTPEREGPLGPFSSSIRLIDLDNDGAGEIIANDFRGRTVRVVPGFLDGAKPREARSIRVGDRPSGIDAFDATGDGNLDLIVAGLRTLQLLRGDGKLGFKKTRTLTVRQAPDRVIVLDKTEKTPTLASVANDTNKIFMLAVQANGALEIKSERATCNAPSKTLATDVDGDGRTDVIYHCRDRVEVQLASGGTVAAVMLPAEDLAAGDFDGDGQVELFITTRPSLSTTKLHYLRPVGGGQFEQFSEIALEGHLASLTAADLDDNGSDELLALRWPGVEPGLLSVWSSSLCPES